MSSNSNSTSSTNGGGLTKRLRAVSTSSRLKVLPSWFSSSKDSRDSKDGKELGYENGMLHCDSPTHLTASGASSVHSSSTSNTPRSPMSMNRIPPPLNHLPQSSNQSQMTRNRPVSEQRSPPPKTKGSDSFSSSDMNRTLISSNTATLDGVSGPLGRFRSRTLGSADRRPSSSNSNVLPPSPSNLISKLPSSYPPSSSKSSSANLKALRRPSKTDTLSSSINGGDLRASLFQIQKEEVESMGTKVVVVEAQRGIAIRRLNPSILTPTPTPIPTLKSFLNLRTLANLRLQADRNQKAVGLLI